MSTEKGPNPRPLDDLNRQQLEIYAKELREHFQAERRLRQELEEQNQQLERRLRELTALNRLFQQHLTERFAVIEMYRSLLARVEELAADASSVADYGRSQPLPDLDPSSSTTPNKSDTRTER